MGTFRRPPGRPSTGNVEIRASSEILPAQGPPDFAENPAWRRPGEPEQDRGCRRTRKGACPPDRWEYPCRPAAEVLRLRDRQVLLVRTYLLAHEEIVGRRENEHGGGDEAHQVGPYEE